MDERRGRADDLVISVVSDQGAFCFARPHRRWGQSEKREARFGNPAGVIEVHNRDGARNSKIAVAPRDFFQRVARSRSENGENDLRKNFIRLQRCGQVIDKKFFCRNDPINSPSRRCKLCIQGQSHGGQLGRGISMN